MNQKQYDFGQATPGNVKQALCICCFGRGGSSLLWHLLGSSPDVWMMRREWHQTVFGERHMLRRLLRRAIRNGALQGLGKGDGFRDRALHSFVRHRIVAELADDDGLKHPNAALIGMKVMDYNIVWHDGIKRSFGGGRTVVLLRNARPQCESLMRSGLTLPQACKKYNDVMGYMASLVERPGTVTVRFEDFLDDPGQEMRKTYAALGVSAPENYVVKVKPYGLERQRDTDVSARNLLRIAPNELRGQVDGTVDENANARLSDTEAAEIDERTAAVRSLVNY